ncbi:MAG: glycosyltransferase family 9 protein [Actinobacteria bacterium]|nr:glycosyltransferase family 9 protein [Actinomycetota bacterium]
MSAHVLVARLDSDGDVLLTGPAVRAVASEAERVTYLCSPRAVGAARLLPGIDDIVAFEAAWVAADPPPLAPRDVTELVDRVACLDIDRALVLTSFHQSPLPLALLLRLAEVPEIAAISVDYPGSLLDVRHAVADDVHEVERNLSLAAAFGYHLPEGDDAALRVVRRPESRPPELPADPYVVVHPGASVPARAWSPERNAALVAKLVDGGWPVVVTGGPSERELCRFVAAAAPGERVVDLGGRVDLEGLAEVLAAAAAVVVGNTGPAHLSAAVGTPVVSLFAPTVPAARWRPWRVPHLLLGDQDIECEGCRARVCPLEGQPCLDGVEVDEVVSAVGELAGQKEAAARMHAPRPVFARRRPSSTRT